MKVVAALFSLLPSAALAHDSLAPHSHPHGASALPDAALMFAAAVLVGLGFMALHRIGKE